jgi:hypothetical protein
MSGRREQRRRATILRLHAARGAAIFCLMLITATVAGCSRGPERLTLVEVSGKLLVNGKPAPGAVVCYHPQAPITGGNAVPFGIVDQQGRYQPGTYVAADGLPVGQYDVTVIWPTALIVDGVEVPSDDRFRGQHSNRARAVQSVTITAETSELPTIELKLDERKP